MLKFIADKTYGESYRTSKFELDPEISSAQIEYDAPTEIVMKHRGETRPPKNYALLKGTADRCSSSDLQILNYFLDGSRRVFKVDDIAYLRSSRKMIYPIVAGQVVAGCCRRVDKKLHEENFLSEIVLALPCIANPDGHKGFFPKLVSDINAQLAERNPSIRLAKILPYNTNHNPAEKFEARAVALIMEQMHDAEKNLVAELVRRGKLDRKNYLVKDGSLEYRILPSDKKKFNAKNYSFVIGVSKKFNPALIKDSSNKLNPGLVADLPPYCRTPVTIFQRTDNLHGGNKFAVWYLRLHDKQFSDSPFDGVVKVEKILVTDAERENEQIDSDEVDLLSAYLLNERNPVCYGTDSRWANHIYPIFLTESFVKSRFISAETFLHLF
ncbi:MAG: hypothetical protein IKE46_09895 [Selenomonadaceae bacterium]|nr:hypothetical protein [Selenomonadaceae bacterium]